VVEPLGTSRQALGLVLLVAGAGLGACTREAPPPAVDRSYAIVAAHSRQCLDVEGSSGADRAQVLQWTCAAGQANQDWRVVGSPGAPARLVARHSGKCLTAAGADPGNPEAVVQASCAEDGSREDQLWQLRGRQGWGLGAAPEVTYQIESAATGTCLDVEGSSKEPGARVLQYDCGPRTPNQQWLFVPAAP
jgi:hypothetical protein